MDTPDEPQTDTSGNESSVIPNVNEIPDEAQMSQLPMAIQKAYTYMRQAQLAWLNEASRIILTQHYIHKYHPIVNTPGGRIPALMLRVQDLKDRKSDSDLHFDHLTSSQINMLRVLEAHVGEPIYFISTGKLVTNLYLFCPITLVDRIRFEKGSANLQLGIHQMVKIDYDLYKKIKSKMTANEFKRHREVQVQLVRQDLPDNIKDNIIKCLDTCDPRGKSSYTVMWRQWKGRDPEREPMTFIEWEGIRCFHLGEEPKDVRDHVEKYGLHFYRRMNIAFHDGNIIDDTGKARPELSTPCHYSTSRTNLTDTLEKLASTGALLPLKRSKDDKEEEKDTRPPKKPKKSDPVADAKMILKQEREIGKIKSQNDALNTQVDEKTEALNKLQTDYTAYRSTMDTTRVNLETRIQQLESEIRFAHNTARDKTLEYQNKLDQEKRSMGGELTKLNDERLVLIRDKNQLHDTMQENSKVMTRLQEENKQVNVLKDEVARLKASDSSRIDLEERIQQYRNDATSDGDHINALEAEKGNLQLQIWQLQDQHELDKSRIDSLDQIVSHFGNDHSTQQLCIDDARREAMTARHKAQRLEQVAMVSTSGLLILSLTWPFGGMGLYTGLGIVIAFLAWLYVSWPLPTHL